MTIETLRIIIALFFLAHGLVHISLSWVPTPQPGALRTPFFPAWWIKDTDPLWPASKLGLSSGIVRTIGWILWILVFAAFFLAALGVFGIPFLSSIWIPLAAAGSIISLLLITLYWHPWFPVGALLDAAILAGLYFQVPAALFPGT